MKWQSQKKTANIATFGILIASIGFIIYEIQTKIFFSETALENFTDQFGFWAPFVFILLQAVQVVFPVLPGGIGCLGGVLIFGPIAGFFYSYIGICCGSVVAFKLAKKYGIKIIEVLFSTKLQKKYVGLTENTKFSKIFAFLIFLPVAPDDFLCYLAGTTKMKLKKFIAIIIFGKPMAIAMYSFGLNSIWQQIIRLIQ